MELIGKHSASLFGFVLIPEDGSCMFLWYEISVNFYKMTWFHVQESDRLQNVYLNFITVIALILFNFCRVLPASVVWLKYLSQFFYSNEALAVVHWQEVDHISK
jgi:hypothetical protein